MPALKGRSTGSGLYILVEDVGRLHEKARESGATVVIEPERTEWGAERCRFLDLEGREWSFGTYQPGKKW